MAQTFSCFLGWTGKQKNQKPITGTHRGNVGRCGQETDRERVCTRETHRALGDRGRMEQTKQSHEWNHSEKAGGSGVGAAQPRLRQGAWSETDGSLERGRTDDWGGT